MKKGQRIKLEAVLSLVGSDKCYNYREKIENDFSEYCVIGAGIIAEGETFDIMFCKLKDRIIDKIKENA